MSYRSSSSETALHTLKIQRNYKSILPLDADTRGLPKEGKTRRKMLQKLSLSLSLSRKLSLYFSRSFSFVLARARARSRKKGGGIRKKRKRLSLAKNCSPAFSRENSLTRKLSVAPSLSLARAAPNEHQFAFFVFEARTAAWRRRGSIQARVRSPRPSCRLSPTTVSRCVSFLTRISVSFPVSDSDDRLFWEATDRARTFELSIILTRHHANHSH